VHRTGNCQAFQLPGNLANFGGALGQPLPNPVRLKMESFFNTSFTDVRVHVGPQASSIGALAFTHGSNLYFAPGQYNTTTTQGQKLLGHELAHVLQQRAGRVANPFGSGVAVVQDQAMEAEADRLGLGAASHRGEAPLKTVVNRPQGKENHTLKCAAIRSSSAAQAKLIDKTYSQSSRAKEVYKSNEWVYRYEILWSVREYYRHRVAEECLRKHAKSGIAELRLQYEQAIQAMENLIKDSGGPVTDWRNDTIDAAWRKVISTLDNLVIALNEHDLRAWRQLDERGDVVYGDPPLSEAEARTIIDTIERGKATSVTRKLMRAGSLFTLKYEDLEHEWGILKYKSADECKLIIGDATGVTWGDFLEVGFPVLHSHPYFEAGKPRNRYGQVSTATKEIAKHGDLPDGVVRWSDLNQKSILTDDQRRSDAQREVSKIFPSASDIEFCGKHKVGVHHVHTTYAVLDHRTQGRCIANPNVFQGMGDMPRLVFVITDARPAGDGLNYTCTMTAMRGAEPFWTRVVTTDGIGPFGLLHWRA
jgi:hypothetical protein